MSHCGCKTPRRAGAVCGCKPKRAGALERAAAVCDRWIGRAPGAEVPCRSRAIGRKLELKVPGLPRQSYELEACAVPRASVRPSKRCTPAFLGRTDGGLFSGERVLLDAGKVKNALRTPRPMHPAMEVEWVSGRLVGGPRDRMRDNDLAGLDRLEGLDVPYPHRAGSSPCCPTSSVSVVELGREVREAYETDELSSDLRARLGRLARHLAGPRHRVEGLRQALGPDDFEAAFAITAAGAALCERSLSDWHTAAEESAAVRKVERKKARGRAKSARARAAKSAKEGGRRAVQALQRQTRTGRALAPLKAAAGLSGRRIYYVTTRDGETNVGVTAANEFPTRAAALEALRRYQLRTGDWRALVVRSERL